MSDPSITTEILPTGGVVALVLTSADQTGPWVLTRSIVGSSLPPVTVYNGPPLAPPQSPSFPMNWVDAGDGTTLPLNPTSSYTWTFQTALGTVTSAAVQPTCKITVLPDQIMDVVFKMLQAGIDSLWLPNGFQNKPRMYQAMPLAGNPPLPFITINDDLLSQSHIGIGDSVNSDQQANQYSVSAVVARRYSITVITTTTDERTFYRDAVISIFRSMAGPALNRLGSNVTHKFQAANSQVTARDQSPGFYYSTIMIDIEGMFNVQVNTDFPYVEVITPDVTMLFPGASPVMA